MPQSNFELRRKLLQLEALYDVGRALNTLRPEAELIEELMQRAPHRPLRGRELARLLGGHAGELGDEDVRRRDRPPELRDATAAG